MNALHETHNWRIYWYDEAQTTLLIEIFDTWTWQDADDGVQTVVNQVEGTTAETFLIVHFVGAGTKIPKNFSIDIMGRIMKTTLNFVGTVIVATSNPLLQSFVDFNGLTRRLPSSVIRFHFVNSLENALALINSIKSERHPDSQRS